MKLKLPMSVAVLGLQVFTACADDAKSQTTEADTFEVLRSYYAVEHLPLDATILASKENDEVVRQHIRFRGVDREWIHATLAMPKGVNSPPIVILLHGITQSKDQWWSKGGEYSFPSLHRQVLVENGIAVLAIDARNHGERIEEKDFRSAYSYLEFSYFEAAKKMIAETAIDVRRAIDYLQTRKDIDSTRLGIAGFSLGAHIAWIASAVDERIDRSLIMAIPATPIAKNQTQSFTDPKLYFPGLQSQPVMMIAAKEDSFYTQAQMMGFYEGVPSDAKEIVWVDGGHDLPDSTAEISRRFFVGKL